MIIDIHNHIVAGEQLQNFQANLINSAGFHRPGGTVVTEKHIETARWRGHKHSEVLNEVGTDYGFISPRPYTMMHSAKPEKIVHWYCKAVNDALALQVKMEPKKFRAIGGLPQNAGARGRHRARRRDPGRRDPLRRETPARAARVRRAT